MVIGVIYVFWFFETLVDLSGSSRAPTYDKVEKVPDLGAEITSFNGEKQQNVRLRSIIGVVIGEVLHKVVDGLALGVSWAVGWSTGKIKSPIKIGMCFQNLLNYD